MAEITEDNFAPYGETQAPPPPPTSRMPISTDATTIDPVTGRPTITVVKPKAAKKEISEEDFQPYESKDEKATAPPYRETSAGEAAVHGYVDLSTMGLAPAIAGAAAAGNAPGNTGIAAAMQGVASENPGAEAVGEGISRLWNDHFGSTPDPQARAAYTEGSQAVLNDRNLASDQHFVPYLLGQLGAAISMPGTLGRAAVTGFFGKIAPSMVEGLTGRLGGAALTGGVMAGAQGAGEAVSEGRPEDIPLEAGKGFATGAALGGAGGAALETAGRVAGFAGRIARGRLDPEAEAGRQILSTLTGEKPNFTPEQADVAQRAGVPIKILDVGSERTRDLERKAANISPKAREALESMTQGRFEQQNVRVSDFIRKRFGGTSTTQDLDRIEAAAQAFNKPMYERAYAAGDRPIWSNELEKLASTEALKKAIGGAAIRGKDRAIADDVNMGAMRPSISVDSQGGVQFTKGPTGVPTYPNLQFWDYAQRELKDQINTAYNNGEKEQGAVMTTLRNRLLKELDNQVPEFGQARQTAASFFGAEDAVEAGQKFVTEDFDPYAAARAIGKFKPVEKQLFARNFATELARRVAAVPDKQDVLNRAFLYSNQARQKINIALDQNGAKEIEALLRVETLIDKGRRALGNSTTARQLASMGTSAAGGGGAVAAYEGLKGEDISPGAILAGAISVHGARHGMQKIDQKVMQRIGEMLASDDVSQLQRGVQSVARSPTILNALRRATGAAVRTGAPDIGFANVAAGATLGAEDIADIFKKKEHKTKHQEPEPVYQDNTP